MAEIVYLLGAGFNCSILDARIRGLDAPLARNFFQVMLGPGKLREKLDGIRQHLFIDELLDFILRYWHLSLDDLATCPFDIEECLTLIESIAADPSREPERVAMGRAAYALRGVLLGYLSDMSMSGAASSPAGRTFGSEVLANDSDVLTFNYDTLAEDAVASASGVGPNPRPPPMQQRFDEVPDEFLGASHLAWKNTLACGFAFDEVALPVAGVSRYVPGARYYSHPDNSLYTSHRVLKLHGSINWLRYTPNRAIPAEFTPDAPTEPPTGLVQERFAHWWLGTPPQRGNWYMDPLIIPPQLFKSYNEYPFPSIWAHALETLSSCRVLVVVGYSFPPTDFRTRRLFLEAFSSTHQLERLIVVNPDTSVVATVRALTSYAGPVVTCDDLTRYYGVPRSWFDMARHVPSSTPPGSVT